VQEHEGFSVVEQNKIMLNTETRLGLKLTCSALGLKFTGSSALGLKLTCSALGLKFTGSSALTEERQPCSY